MTDKEMAEKSFFYKELTYKVCNEERTYIDGFLDGLKVGRPQWHYVKDELPETSGRYFVYTGGGVSLLFLISIQKQVLLDIGSLRLVMIGVPKMKILKL